MHTTWHSIWPCSLLPSQAEAKQNNGSVFRRNLLNRLQQEFKAREETRLRSLQEWVCYVTFICNVFDYLKVRESCIVRVLRLLCQLCHWSCLHWTLWPSCVLNSQVNNMPMVALVHPVFDCLLRLAQPDALNNEEEVSSYTYTVVLQISIYRWIAFKGYRCRQQQFSLELRNANTSIRNAPGLTRWTVWCCSCTASGISWRRWTTSGWTSSSSCCGMASCSWRGSAPWAGSFCWRSWSSGLVAGHSVTRPRSTTTAKSLTDLWTCTVVGWRPEGSVSWAA